jgi:hypothetical protein
VSRLIQPITSDKAFVNDDLTAIMKVHSYDDLAHLSVNEIVLGLKAEKQIPSRTMIEAWIAQAKMLAVTADKQDQTPNLKATVDVPQWKPIASFVLEFQVLETPDGSKQYRTSAHHIETDKNQLWSGIEQVEFVRWMMAEAGIQTEPSVQSSDPKIEVLASASNYPVQFSEKLQRILAKTAKITGTMLPPQIQMIAETPTPKKVDITPQFSGFSEKMQQILAKTQKATMKAG